MIFGSFFELEELSDNLVMITCEYSTDFVRVILNKFYSILNSNYLNIV